MKFLLFLLTLVMAQELHNNQRHRKHHRQKKELEFVQVSADLNDQRIIIEGIIEQVNQLALLVQRQNFFDEQLKNRPFELIRQLDALDLKRNNEETKIIDSLKQQLNIISQTMNKADSIQQCTNQSVCQICKASVYYILDDDNWYMIGFEHGFKKEFQYLLDSAKTALGHSDILLTFSSENNICLEFQNMRQSIEINSVLQLYLGQSLKDFENKLIGLPTHGIPQLFQVRAEYVGRQFIYKDLKFSVIDSQPRDIMGGRLNKLEFSIDQQNVLISCDGQLFLQSSIFPFQFHTTKGVDNIEQISVKYSKQLAEQYVSPIHLQDGQKFSQMSASTIVSNQEIILAVDFD